MPLCTERHGRGLQCWRECTVTAALPPPAAAAELHGTDSLENRLAVLKKLNPDPSYHSTITLLGIYQNDLKIYVPTKAAECF